MLLVAISGVLFFGAFTVELLRQVSDLVTLTNRQASLVSASAVVDSEQASKPIRLKIPKIGVSAAIEYVGLDAVGAMIVPERPESVGWFKLGAMPGENGSAVIAGHYGWKDDVQAVFDNLNKLKIGDQIYVTDKKGDTVMFVVREIRSYAWTDDASEVFSSDDGKSHLNLITCEGVWNDITETYSQRLVIFADKE